MSKTLSLKDAHQYAHNGGEVLIVKCVDRDGTSHGGFRWPLEVGATKEAKDE